MSNPAEMHAESPGGCMKFMMNGVLIAGTRACSGKFSSDRTIAEYAAGIWNAIPCRVE